jgi:hypothetical protein
LWPNSLGQIDFTFFFKGNPVPGSVMSLTDDNIINVPLAGQSDLINTVTFRMDQDSSGSSSGYATEKTYEYPASISLYGQFGQQVIESAGMRSGLQGIFIGDRVANMIFKRQGLKNLMFQEVNLLWSACVLEPGDITDVTSAHVPDRAAGVMGISGKLFEVFDRKWNFNDGIVTVRLLDATYLSTAGTSLIAENTVPAFLSASTLQKTTYMFLCNDSDTYSNGTAAAKLV